MAADYYALLRVAADAPVSAIRRAYHAAVLELHPDKRAARGMAGGAAHPGASDTPQQHSAFLAIQEAWETLRDPDRRADYDARASYGAGEAAAAAQSARVHVSDTLELGEMDYEEEGDAFKWACRCGGEYRVPGEETLEVDSVIVPCTGCSLRVRVMVPPAEAPGAPAGEASGGEDAEGGGEEGRGPGGGQDHEREGAGGGGEGR
jgi:diphthamide biosynthesis protein 4